MSSVFYRFEHSSPAVRGRKFECNLSATDSRAGSVKADKRHNLITAGSVERISAIFVESLFSKRESDSSLAAGKCALYCICGSLL